MPGDPRGVVSKALLPLDRHSGLCRLVSGNPEHGGVGIEPDDRCARCQLFQHDGERAGPAADVQDRFPVLRSDVPEQEAPPPPISRQQPNRQVVGGGELWPTKGRSEVRLLHGRTSSLRAQDGVHSASRTQH